MSISHLLEDFGTLSATHGEQSADLTEAERLQAFESGYSAGWEDALKATSESNTQLSEEISENLRAVSVSVEETEKKLVASLSPLFQHLVSALLPDVAKQSLAPRIAQELKDMAKGLLDPEVELVASAADQPALETFLEGLQYSQPILTIDPNLCHGQVFLRVGSVERQVDLNAALQDISQSIATFFKSESEG